MGGVQVQTESRLGHGRVARFWQRRDELDPAGGAVRPVVGRTIAGVAQRPLDRHARLGYDHLTQFFERSEAAREMVTNLMEMYLSILNNQMAKAANDTNATVRRLTFITTIFMPLTLLARIGGLSERTMRTGADYWRVSYPLFIVAMLIIGVANYYLLRWIERWGRENDGPGKAGSASH